MAEDSFLFESGEAVSVGNHGDTDYVFAGGEPVPNSGESDFVFESGIGLGGGPVVIGGTNVGFFETSETWDNFWNYTNNEDEANANGLQAFGIDDNRSEHTAYVFVVYSSAEDAFALCIWTFEDTGLRAAFHTVFQDFGGAAIFPANPQVEDDPSGSGSGTNDDYYDTDSNGDPVGSFGYKTVRGDGMLHEFENGSYEVTVTMGDDYHPDDPRGSLDNNEAGTPDVWRGRGPDANVNKTAGPGTTITVQINNPSPP